MQPAAITILSLEFDAILLLWIGAALLILGLFFALAGRRPTRRNSRRGPPRTDAPPPARKPGKP